MRRRDLEEKLAQVETAVELEEHNRSLVKDYESYKLMVVGQREQINGHLSKISTLENELRKKNNELEQFKNQNVKKTREINGLNRRINRYDSAFKKKVDDDYDRDIMMIAGTALGMGIATGIGYFMQGTVLAVESGMVLGTLLGTCVGTGYNYVTKNTTLLQHAVGGAVLGGVMGFMNAEVFGPFTDPIQQGFAGGLEGAAILAVMSYIAYEDGKKKK